MMAQLLLRFCKVVSCGWIIATATTQSPWRSLDRLQRLDFFQNAMPNWRFFAPNPAQQDMRVLFRWEQHGEASDWRPIHFHRERMLLDAIWYPERRAGKALSDTAFSTFEQLGGPHFEESVAYRLLRGRVRAELEELKLEDVAGFQFVLARDAGYDHDVEPEYIYFSRFEPV